MANLDHQHSFDPATFLAQMGVGRRMDKYAEGEIVFSQGDPWLSSTSRKDR